MNDELARPAGGTARPWDATRATRAGSRGACERRVGRGRGQIIPIFAIMIVVLMGLTALVVDVSWYWSNTLKVQRAADAAALAGAVWLPGDLGAAYGRARDEATKNGYDDADPNVAVTPIQDSQAVAGGNPNQLDVAVSTQVTTFFMRVFGIRTITATRVSKAEYVQPVPMGSPLNYYGVYQDCKVSGSNISCSSIPDASGSGTLATQGFFGAIEGQGANRATGDAFATGYNADPTANAQYDRHGYDYGITIPASGASVYIYDPTFCATTSGPGGGHLGAGDHWLSTANHGTAVPVSTYFRLWDTNGTPFTTSDDGLNHDGLTPNFTSGTMFMNEFQVDKSPAYARASVAGGQDNNFSDGTEPSLGGTTNCATITDPAAGGYWHNRWWNLASNVAAGTYRLNVQTTDSANATLNQNQAFENMWSLEVIGGGSPTIYGSGRMVSYANIQSGSQLFYLARITKNAGAGKTMEIDLFDPGDVGDKAWLQILSPDGNAYNPMTFSYTADGNAASGHTSGTNVNCIQTYGNNSSISPPAGCTANYTSGGQFY
ncbi:MAG TPA: pilus assembly protein TadG-related protein, partial [Candidatus Limnocylindrales bacterium]